MKRTTLKIDEAVLRQLKQKADSEGISLQDLANRLLRRGLAAPQQPAYVVHLKGWAAATQPGVDILDREALFDVMNGR